MGDVVPEFRRRRDAAVAELSDFFSKRPNSRALEAAECAQLSATAGWLTRVERGGNAVEVAYTVDERLPFSLPKIYADKSLCLKIPHVNGDGNVCVVPNQASWSQVRTTEIAKELLALAEEVLLGTPNKQDFIEEFQDYWRCQKLGKTDAWSLLDPTGESRSIAFFPGQSYTLLGEGIDECRDWLKNRFAQPTILKTLWSSTVVTSEDAQQFQIRTTMFLRLKEPLYPDQYPNSARDVGELAKRAGAGAYDCLLKELAAAESSLPILIGFDTSSGPALACVWLPRPANVKNGFRGAPNQQVVANRWLSSSPVVPIEVRRVDSKWLGARTAGNDVAQSLAEKRVVVVGCGSLGADIAALLAKAGVGNFILIDGDILGWENVGRHLLGGDDVGRRKDEALRRYLSTQLPHLWIKRPEGRKWETVYADDPALLSKADLLVSTTGDWPCDSALNLLARRRLDTPPMIFGWTEAYGVAGHGLAVLDAGGCLGCGMNEVGRFCDAVVEWPNNSPTIRRAPACGEFFQPFGPIEAAHIKSMIAALAVDVLLGKVTRSTLRSWIGPREAVESSAGKWSAEWAKKYGNPADGNIVRAVEWPRNPKCELCK